MPKDYRPKVLKQRKPREYAKGIFLGWERKATPGVIYSPGQIPPHEAEFLAKVCINVLKQRKSEPEDSGRRRGGQAG
ncbi:hypothetical protein [Sporomusa carbonis]|uniref:hypothetical protein n=1 Tax=Sporomusa carbonis TaxID=3076075 RepID=UPI003C7C18A3